MAHGRMRNGILIAAAAASMLEGTNKRSVQEMTVAALANYVDGDELRVLPCDHYLH